MSLNEKYSLDHTIVVNRLKGFCVKCKRQNPDNPNVWRTLHVDELIDNERLDWSLSCQTRCTKCGHVVGN